MTKYTVLPINSPIFDKSDMEQIECGEAAMGTRLRLLGWSKTRKFGSWNIYLDNSGKTIGATIYRPQDGPCEHTHYALRLPDNA